MMNRIRGLLTKVAAGLLAIAAVVTVLGTGPGQATAALAADAPVCRSSDVEFLGQSQVLNKTNFGGYVVGELSGLAYDPQRGVYYAVADRAGTVTAHVFTLTLRVNDDKLETPAIIAVATLAGPNDVPFDGFNFDGEGIALASSVDMYVSSEGGSGAGQQPAIEHFSIYGGRLASLSVPSIFQIGTNNLSFESLALSPSGASLFTAVEGPLRVDGLTSDNRGRIRILRYGKDELGKFVPAQQYFYLTERGRNATELGVTELIALSDTDLLVLERGFVENQGNTVRVFRVSLSGAADVARQATLAAEGLQPLRKTLVVDLTDCPSGGATIAPGASQPHPLLDNFEAMTLGPELGNGRRVLVLLSDDNLGSNQTTRIVALAVRLP